MIRITPEGGRIGRFYWINSDPATVRDCAGVRCILWGKTGILSDAISLGSVLIRLQPITTPETP